MWYKTRTLYPRRNPLTTAATAGGWFEQGLRAFFTLEYSGTGDGLIFALINGNLYKTSGASVGGDSERNPSCSATPATPAAMPTPTPVPSTAVRRGLGPSQDRPRVRRHAQPELVLRSQTAADSATQPGGETRNDPGVPAPAATTRSSTSSGAPALDVPCRRSLPARATRRAPETPPTTTTATTPGRNPCGTGFYLFRTWSTLLLPSLPTAERSMSRPTIVAALQGGFTRSIWTPRATPRRGREFLSSPGLTA